jgi:hypothetical protein
MARCGIPPSDGSVVPLSLSVCTPLPVSPVDAEDIDGMAALEAVGVPVIGFEAEYRLDAFRRLLELRAVSLLQFNITCCGGISRALRIIALAGLQGARHAAVRIDGSNRGGELPCRRRTGSGGVGGVAPNSRPLAYACADRNGAGGSWKRSSARGAGSRHRNPR